MGRTWPNLAADPVKEAGYYWNERLSKLARLQVGEKLPRKPGHWELVAHEGEGSSSQVAGRLFQRYPGMSLNELTFTVRSPLGRRIPLGDRRAARAIWFLAAGAAALALGMEIARRAWALGSRRPKRAFSRLARERRALRSFRW